MAYNFDEIIDRRNTNSEKYDFAVESGKPADVLPLWVADMDFRVPKGVLARIQKDIDLGIFGYSNAKEDYFKVLHRWYLENFGWDTKPEWLVKTSGVVFAIATAVRAFTKEGDAVIIQQPVYYPFSSVVKNNNRKLVNSPLVLRDGRYEMDLEDFERKIVENDVKLFILCSPHNPVGRVWTKEELQKVADICLKYQILIVSDEIHSDFTYEGHQHMMLASLGDVYADQVITCTAPSKTFNIAGLQVSNIFIPNKEKREQFQKVLTQTGYGGVNMIGLSACQAAYESGKEWLDELKEYLKGNLEFVRHFLKERLPEITLIEPEGTYLIWLDFRRLQLTEEEREHFIVNEAKLWLDSGVMFGDVGEGFERVNIACPRDTLQEALERLERAIRKKEVKQ